jgi:type 1 glutamine amidotransferase
MRKCGNLGALLGLCLLGGISFAAPSRLAFAAGPQKTVPVVLWVGGFAHDFDAFARILSRRLPERAAGIRVEVARDAAFLLRPQPQRPAVILMDHCYQSAQGVLDEQQKTNLLEWVRGGVGVVAVHASYYSFPEWKEVRELYGPRFIKHEKVDQYIAGKFVDRTHPITRGLPETFRLHSELYQSTPLPADCHLLAVARDEGATAAHPSIWTRSYGQGRVATIFPAHWPDAYNVQEFQQLIANSVLWAAERPRE